MIHMNHIIILFLFKYLKFISFFDTVNNNNRDMLLNIQ